MIGENARPISRNVCLTWGNAPKSHCFRRPAGIYRPEIHFTTLKTLFAVRQIRRVAPPFPIRKEVEKSADGKPDLKTMREFLHDVVAVRRGDHSAARLKLEQERLEREREKTKEEVVEHFKRWLKNPGVRDMICRMTSARKSADSSAARDFRLWRQNRRKHAPEARSKPRQTQSNPVKPIPADHLQADHCMRNLKSIVKPAAGLPPGLPVFWRVNI